MSEDYSIAGVYSGELADVYPEMTGLHDPHLIYSSQIKDNPVVDQSIRKNVLITGAFGNVGKACSQLFGSKGWRSRLVSRRSGVDLSKMDSVQSWRKDIVKQGVLFDVVVMSHGVQRLSYLDYANEDDWKDIIDNNLTASYNLISTLVKYSLLNNDSLTVFFSSIQATQPRAGRAIYAAAKAGIEGLMRGASVEIAKYAASGARAVALRIGQMTEAMDGINFTQEQLDKVRETTLTDLVSPTEIANLIYDLYPLKSITGEVIEVSSGHKYSIW